jgi:hypothetical protein
MISQDLAIKLIQLILEDDKKRALSDNGNGNGNGNGDATPEPGTIISGGERKAS